MQSLGILNKSGEGIRMSKLRLRIFDGSRRPFSEPAKFLVTVTDGHQVQHERNYFESSDITFELPFFNNSGDRYSVVVWADGYRQAGFAPVLLSANYVKTLDIMLVPDDARFSFAQARWSTVRMRYPFIGNDLDNVGAEARYENFMESSQKALACLLNLGEAMSQITLVTRNADRLLKTDAVGRAVLAGAGSLFCLV